MKTEIAYSKLRITVYCPYCGLFQDKSYTLKPFLVNGNLSKSKIDYTVNCIGCHELFIVSDIKND